MAQRNFVTHPLVVRQLEVARVVDVTPRMRRVTLVGEQLSAFHRDGFDLPAFTSPMFDDHVKLVFAEGGDLQSALPVQRARSIDWPPAEHRRGRDYTPRRFDPVAGELDLDFVLHGAGPAVEWVRRARPGDVLHFAGPKSSLVLPDDLDWIVLAADETGLPAVGRFLDERPSEVPVDVVIEIGDPSAVQDLAVRPEDTVRWVGTDQLERALHDLDWRDGNGYVWAAGEAGALLPVRRWLRGERGMAPSHVNVTGYWHREDTEGATGSPEAVAGLLDPVPWFAVRAAADLGLLTALGGRPTSTGMLAETVDVEPGRLGVLLDYLASLQVAIRNGEDWSLGPVGTALADDEHLFEEYFGAGVEARALEALVALPQALREGTSPWRARRGRSAWAEATEDAAQFASLVEETEAFDFVAAGLLELPTWAAAESVLLTGPGAASVVRVVQQTGEPVRMGYLGGPVESAALAAATPGVPVAEQADRADLVVSARGLGCRSDDEVVEHLSALHAVADVVLLVDVLSWTGPGSTQAAAEHALAAFAVTGVATRTPGTVGALAARAGWQLVDQTSLGWDHECFVLRPVGRT